MKGEKFLLSQNIGFRTDLYLSTEDYSNIGKGSLQKKNFTKNGKSPEFSTTNDLDFLNLGKLGNNANFEFWTTRLGEKNKLKTLKIA